MKVIILTALNLLSITLSVISIIYVLADRRRRRAAYKSAYKSDHV